MKDFFVNQWLNFKKNWYWYIIWVLIVGFIFPNLIETIMYLFCFSIDSTDLPVGYCFGFPYWLATQYKVIYLPYVVVCLCFLFKYLLDIQLYIYSYYIYTGKRNWYKFFYERQQLHKKEDSNAYKEYLKQIKDSTMQNKKED